MMGIRLIRMRKFLMSRGKGHVPLRTCISCGKKREKPGLIRLALDADGTVLCDDRGRRGGRGAYVCPNRSCLEKIGLDGRLYRAFRTRVNIANPVNLCLSPKLARLPQGG
jgi:predicted RNA-binding protein YlxR (DUF448 family)